MRVANLRIENFRGVKTGFVQFGKHPVLIGDNNTGKTTLIEAMTLVLGRDRLVRELTEHDFYGSNPQAADRIKIVATVTDFPEDDPEQSSQWFRDERAVVKWLDEMTGQVHPRRENPEWKLCCQLGVQARFDHESLAVETIRYFHDHEEPIDPFADEAPAPVPGKLIQELSFYLVRASRTWDKVFSWGNELFKRTVLAAAAQPAGSLLAERDRLRAPAQPIDADPGIQPLIQNLNSELALSFPNAPKVQLRLTSTDSRSVMEAVSAHFAGADGFSIPAGRQGSGLVSMQGLLLLLELGRARALSGGEFLMALEEPEIHLPPSAQQRLVQRVQALSTQTFVTTHSPLVASIADPTSVLVLKKHEGVLSAEPFLASPLAAAAPNWKRKFFQHSRMDVLSALMQPVLLVPEGRADFQLIRCILRPLMMTEGWIDTMPRPFGIEVGVVPTEDANVVETQRLMRRLHQRVCCLVDGDAAGLAYANQLRQEAAPPSAIIRWHDGAMIEDAIGWILDADEAAVVAKLAEISPQPPTSSADIVAYLKSKKMDIIAYESLADAIATTQACRGRAADLLSGLACACVGDEATQRFARGADGVWVFQP
ncbi:MULTISPECIES: ATP-dependent nuclease [Pseudomonas syringae group]|uniref:Chromosome partition protein n=1 Tax=Pseudomonas savastanoi pv. glycinea TaxID=318 RepID=A0A3M3G9F9_PSESG|nr:MULTISPECIES: AAA family ATPase [Pseudomonas syringae group]KPB87935.1 Chromosome partition protein [Pseudomonas syringae pv. maculicola]AQL36464.1 chromosome partitioning protein [Pseudomonas syringae pv. actinidiae ICMP 9853]EGH66213.1 chromosome partition protein [Pseudomonas syringae pv. actinidiae str. M302091]EPM63520.1 chromosome partition protein [Pseudomonas syringae pv. actinidiae ICMP 19103]EPM90416.1 chromosome partition protein [Pseudomonas syringae pv. actinidiae ICMP 19068]